MSEGVPSGYLFQDTLLTDAYHAIGVHETNPPPKGYHEEGISEPLLLQHWACASPKLAIF